MLRSRLYFACLFASSLLVAGGCSDSGDSISIGPVANSNQRRPHLDPRTNPLETYIRDNWVNQSATSTGGSHYGHIKIFGFSHANLDTCQVGASCQEDADFIAEHFDAFMWGGLS